MLLLRSGCLVSVEFAGVCRSQGRVSRFAVKHATQYGVGCTLFLVSCCGWSVTFVRLGSMTVVWQLEWAVVGKSAFLLG